METQKEYCPGCRAVNPTNEHLLKEYHELLKAGFNNMFGQNARKACNAVIDLLGKRGIKGYISIFGLHKFKKWTY
jgi:hypothetical protein